MSHVVPVEVVALCASAIPAVRLLARRPLRVTFPRLWITLLVVLGAFIVAIGVCVVVAPRVLHVATPMVIVVSILLALRARTGSGRRHGVPPGSLSLTASLEALADRQFYLDRSRRLGPVFKVAQFTRPTACVVGLERGHRLLREQSSALETPPLAFSHEIEGGFLRYMDDQAHDRYGPLFRRALARPVVAAAERVALETARRELARHAARCATAGLPVAPGAALAEIVFTTYLHALMGIEPGSPDERAFREAYAPIDRWSISRPLGSKERAGLDGLRALMRSRLVDAGAKAPSVIVELRRLDPSMPDETALDNLVFMLKIAVSNTTGLLHWVLWMLGSDTRWRARLASAQAASSEGDDLIGNIVSETLRLAQSEYVYRQVVDDIAVDSCRIPKGWLLRLCVWESHRDPAVFADPDAFEPERFANRAYSTSEYAPFGVGRHACNGIALNDIVCRSFLTVLSADYDWRVAGRGEPAHDLRHWRHWRPSPTLALALEPKQEPIG